MRGVAYPWKGQEIHTKKAPLKSQDPYEFQRIFWKTPNSAQPPTFSSLSYPVKPNLCITLLLRKGKVPQKYQTLAVHPFQP